MREKISRRPSAARLHFSTIEAMSREIWKMAAWHGGNDRISGVLKKHYRT